MSETTGSETIRSETIRVEIFDPPLCCPSGLCGPAIDAALLDVNEALLRLKEEFNGQAQFERYLLGQQAPVFLQHREVVQLLKTEGVKVLPITTVQGKIVRRGSYPSYDELKGAIEQEAGR